MFENPLSVIGLVVAAGGWLFLLFGVGVDTGFGGPVANLHAVSIANSAIITGLALFIGGIVAGGQTRAIERLHALQETTRDLKKWDQSSEPKAQSGRRSTLEELANNPGTMNARANRALRDTDPSDEGPLWR